LSRDSARFGTEPETAMKKKKVFEGAIGMKLMEHLNAVEE
jgi:hypothetical protein